MSLGDGTAVAELCDRAGRSGWSGQPIGGRRGPIVVIDRCEPARSYLVRCLEEATDGAHVIAFASAAHWLQVATDCPRPRVVLFCNSGREDPDSEIENELSLVANLVDVPVIAVPGAVVAAHYHAPGSQVATSDGPASCEMLNSAEREGQGQSLSLEFSPN